MLVLIIFTVLKSSIFISGNAGAKKRGSLMRRENQPARPTKFPFLGFDSRVKFRFRPDGNRVSVRFVTVFFKVYCDEGNCNEIQIMLRFCSVDEL